MFCEHCGAQIDDNVKICPNCGCYAKSGKSKPASFVSEESIKRTKSKFTKISNFCNFVFLFLILVFLRVPLTGYSVDCFVAAIVVNSVGSLIAMIAIALSIAELVCLKKQESRIYLWRCLVCLLSAGCILAGGILLIEGTYEEFVGICNIVYAGILIMVNAISLIVLSILSKKGHNNPNIIKDKPTNPTRNNFNNEVNQEKIISLIKGYKELLDSGAITKEEFQRLKEKILK